MPCRQDALATANSESINTAPHNTFLEEFAIAKNQG